MQNIKTLKIVAKDYILDFDQLNNFMAEFYGRLLENANVNEIENGIFEFGFDDEAYIPEAITAIQSFKIKK